MISKFALILLIFNNTLYTYPIYIKLACMIRMITLILPLCCLFNPERHELARGIYIIREVYIAMFVIRIIQLKGTATLITSMLYLKELYEPWILIQVSSKSVEKWASYGHLKNSIWPTFSRHFEYLISFQIFFNCLIFSHHYCHIICVSADMQLYA